MKKTLLAAAVLCTCFASQAFAQDKNFEGFSVGINANSVRTSTDASGATFTASASKTSSNASLQANYGFALSDSFVLGVGATVGLGDLDAGSTTVLGLPVSLKSKNLYAINVEPGYLVSNTTVAYAKIAYQSMKGEVQMTGGGTQDFHGTGYGLGVRTMLDKNLYLQFEASQVDYNAASISGVSYRPKQTTASIGIGYRF